MHNIRHFARLIYRPTCALWASRKTPFKNRISLQNFLFVSTSQRETRFLGRCATSNNNILRRSDRRKRLWFWTFDTCGIWNLLWRMFDAHKFVSGKLFLMPFLNYLWKLWVIWAVLLFIVLELWSVFDDVVCAYVCKGFPMYHQKLGYFSLSHIPIAQL